MWVALLYLYININFFMFLYIFITFIYNTCTRKEKGFHFWKPIFRCLLILFQRLYNVILIHQYLKVYLIDMEMFYT